MTALALQALDLLADRRLADVQALGGPAEVQQLGDLGEVLQLAQFHPGIVPGAVVTLVE